MTAIEKFTFALSFDDADNVIRSAGDDDEHYALGKKKKKKKDDTPPPPPAVYTEEQAAQMVADAERKGHEEGFAEGHKQGFEQAHQEIMASLEKAVGDVESEIAVKLDHIDEQQKRANAKINEDAIHVALGIIRKLAPAWSKQYQMTEIEDIVRQCLANLFDAPKVMIKVNPDLEKEVGEAAERIAVSRGFSGRVVVVGEPDVAVGDCQVSWGDGTAVRDSARVWSEINAVIDGALSLHANEHGLSQSDMGDPDVQESRLPEEPATQAATTSPQSGQPVEERATPEIESSTSQHAQAPQHGDGTNPRNVQTSDVDVMNAPGNKPENPELQAHTSDTPSQPAQEPARNVINDGEVERAPENETTQVSGKQLTDAEDEAAVKQPPQDVGDENG